MHIRRYKFANFYKLYFSLTYNLEIGKEAFVGESHSHLNGFIMLRITVTVNRAFVDPIPSRSHEFFSLACFKRQIADWSSATQHAKNGRCVIHSELNI